jgi:hypothetical protein
MDSLPPNDPNRNNNSNPNGRTIAPKEDPPGREIEGSLQHVFFAFGLQENEVNRNRHLCLFPSCCVTGCLFSEPKTYITSCLFSKHKTYNFR